MQSNPYKKGTMTLKFRIDKPFDINFSVSVRVTSEGIFTCTLPENISKLFEGKIYLSKARRVGNPGYFSSDTLDGLKVAVRAKLDELCSEKEVKRERIIRFAVETACSYGIDAEGNVTPYPVGKSNWHSGTTQRDATNRGPFGIRIYARVFEKVTYCYEATGKERVEYIDAYEHGFDDSKLEDPAQWLCNMRSLDYTTDRFGESSLTVQEIPYTEEAAQFFVGMFKWLFNMNERLKPFLNPDGIQLLIAAGTQKLLRQ